MSRYLCHVVRLLIRIVVCFKMLAVSCCRRSSSGSKTATVSLVIVTSLTFTEAGTPPSSTDAFSAGRDASQYGHRTGLSLVAPVNVEVIRGVTGLRRSWNSAPSAPRWEPPDTQVAAGPSHLVELVNGGARILSKSGTSISERTIQSFFGVADSIRISDPRIRYDAGASRWFATAFTKDSVAGLIRISVSSSSDPTAVFRHYSFPISSNFPDYPGLGISDDKVVVTAHAFGCRNGNCADPDVFIGGQYWVFSKADLVSQVASPTLDYRGAGQGLFTISPSTVLSSSGTLYIVGGDYTVGQNPPSSTSLRILSLTGVPGVGSGITITQVVRSIRPLTGPPPAQQSGSAEPIDTGDNRILDVVVRNGALWATAGASCRSSGDTEDRACLRFFRISTASLTIVEDFDLGLAGRSFFFPAITLDSEGNVIATFSGSSGTIFPSVYAVGWPMGDSVSSASWLPILLKAGEGPYLPTSPGQYRWGDYSGASVDPSDQTHVWLAAEYARNDTSSEWGTWLAEVRLPALLGDLNRDGVVNSFDYARMVRNWSPSIDVCGSVADLNSDCRVNSVDWSLMGARWGRSAPVTAGSVTTALIGWSGSGVTGIDAPDVDRMSFAGATPLARFVLSPSASLLPPGSTTDIAVLLDTAGASIDAADAVILYDPSKLQVSSIRNGSLFGEYPSPSTSVGRLMISGVTTVSDAGGASSPFSGSGVFATVTFRVLPDAAEGLTTISVDFDGTNAAKTTDANIVEHDTIAEMLSSVANPDLRVCRSCGPAHSAWPMYRHDAQRTGRSPYSGPAWPALKWQYSASGGGFSQPAIAPDGTVYFGIVSSTDAGHFFAVNPNGTAKWLFHTVGRFGYERDVWSSPAVSADGSIYFGAGSFFSGSYGYMFSLRQDGTLQWSREFIPFNYPHDGSGIVSSPMISPSGYIIVGSGDGYLYKLDPFTGSGISVFSTSYGLSSSASMSPNGVTYFTAAGQLYAVSSTGYWSLPAAYGNRETPALSSSGDIYVLGDNAVRSIGSDGSLRWTYSGCGTIDASPGVGGDDTVYALSNIGFLCAINHDGTLRWRYAIGSGYSPSNGDGPTIGGDGTIYVQSNSDGYAYAVNPDGTLKWRFFTGGGSSPVIGADGTLYISSGSGLLAIGLGSPPSPSPTATPTATSTMTPTPTPTSGPCDPRPAVRVVTSLIGDGRLQVSIVAGYGVLSQIQFGSAVRPLVNAIVDVPGMASNITTGRIITLPSGTVQTTFYVRRQSPGSATTVPLVVTDGCGSWETLVGGGSRAGF